MPLLGAKSLADSSAEVIDGSTLSVLLQRALEVERKEEEAVEAAELVELEEKLAAAEERLLAVLRRLCFAGFAGDDTARAVFGQTSTEASGRIYSIFYVNVNLDPEVDSRRENLDIISASSIWQFLRQLQRLLEEFQVFFYVKVDTNSEVDFGACPGAVRTRKSGHYSYELSDDVSRGILSHFAAFFALRPHGRECPFFSPR